MFLINGERRHCVDVSDRGFQYGDGVFETLEVCQGKALFWQRHVERLLKGCQILGIPSPDLSLLQAEAGELIAGSDRAVLKLMITRGSGGRGYRQPDPVTPTRVLSLHPFPQYPECFQTEGVVVRVCEQRLAINPGLAGIKHLNRLEQVLARAEWQDEQIQEGLMLDYADHVIEGTMSNVFLIKQDGLHTPALNNAGIAGIVRQIILELASLHGIPCLETSLDRPALMAADGLFVCNSIIGIWPVKQLDQQRFHPHHLTSTLQQLYQQARLREIAA